MDKPQWIEQHTSRDQQPGLIEAVAALFRTKRAAEWAALLDDADCCFSRVISPAQLLDDPQIRARGLVGIAEDGLPWMRSPIRLGDGALDLEAAPAYGEHTRETLAAIGYAAGEIDRLMDTGVIRQAP